MNELGPEARSIVEAGRSGDDPTGADRARVKKALLISLAAGGALGAAPTAAQGALAAASVKTAGASLLLAAKVLATVVVIGAAGVGIARLNASSAPVVSSVPPALTAAPSNEAPPSIDAPPPIDPPAPPPVDPAPVAIAQGAPAAAITARPAAKPAAPAVPTATPDADTLEAETRRLREAHGALQSGDPGKALALLDEQSTAYAKGELREERAAARILTLCKLGRLDEARIATARFLQESPHSPLADRVRSGCPARPSP